MKKRVWLMTAVVCMLLGGALFSIGRVMGGKGIVIDFSENETVNLIGSLEEYTFTDMDYEAFESVMLDVPNCNIYVGHSHNEKFGIDMKLYTYNYDDIDFEILDDEAGQSKCLLIRNSSEAPKISFNFDFFNISNEQYIRLYLPDSEYDYIRVGTENNNIVFDSVAAENEVWAECKNGSITFTDVSAANVWAHTSNSNVSIDGADAKKISIQTTNGKAELKSAFADTITTKTSNGKINFEDVSGTTAVLETSNGDISMDNVGFDDSLDVKTSNGDIELVLIGEKDDYSYDIKTSNAQIKLDGDNYGKRYEGGNGESDVKLVTSNAKVIVKFKTYKSLIVD